MTTLCIDIGNTRAKWAIFKNREMLYNDALPDLSISELRYLCDQWTPDAAIISAVRGGCEELFQYLGTRCRVLELSQTTPLPFTNLYATPETLGHDRLALVAGGISVFPGSDLLIISAGTCITFDFINKAGEYLGGSIHPGIRMRLKAMHTFTGKLPEVAPEIPNNIIGNTTVTSLQIGAITGAGLEISGMITAFKDKFDDLRVIKTGGDAGLLVTTLENEIFAFPLLSLTGLNEILTYNAASL